MTASSSSGWRETYIPDVITDYVPTIKNMRKLKTLLAALLLVTTTSMAQTDSATYVRNLTDILNVTLNKEMVKNTCVEELAEAMKGGPKMFGFESLTQTEAGKIAKEYVERYLEEEYARYMAPICYGVFQETLSSDDIAELHQIVTKEGMVEAIQHLYSTTQDIKKVSQFSMLCNTWLQNNVKYLFSGTPAYTSPKCEESYKKEFDQLFPHLRYSDLIQEYISSGVDKLKYISSGVKYKLKPSDYAKFKKAMSKQGQAYTLDICLTTLSEADLRLLNEAYNHPTMDSIMNFCNEANIYFLGKKLYGWCIYYGDCPQEDEFHEAIQSVFTSQPAFMAQIETNKKQLAESIKKQFTVSFELSMIKTVASILDIDQERAKKCSEDWVNKRCVPDMITYVFEPVIRKNMTLEEIKEIQQLLSQPNVSDVWERINKINSDMLHSQDFQKLIRRGAANIIYGRKPENIKPVKCPKEYKTAFIKSFKAMDITQMTTQSDKMMKSTRDDVKKEKIKTYLWNNIQTLYLNNYYGKMSIEDLEILTTVYSNTNFKKFNTQLISILDPNYLSQKSALLLRKCYGWTYYTYMD